MRALLTRTDFMLDARSQRGWAVRCAATLSIEDQSAARVWLTREGDRRDYWLKNGEKMRLQRGERIWLSNDADEPVRISLQACNVSVGLLTEWAAGGRPRTGIAGRFGSALFAQFNMAVRAVRGGVC